jgi:hypothetical protein
MSFTRTKNNEVFSSWVAETEAQIAQTSAARFVNPTNFTEETWTHYKRGCKDCCWSVAESPNGERIIYVVTYHRECTGDFFASIKDPSFLVVEGAFGSRRPVYSADLCFWCRPRQHISWGCLSHFCDNCLSRHKGLGEKYTKALHYMAEICGNDVARLIVGIILRL